MEGSHHWQCTQSCGVGGEGCRCGIVSKRTAYCFDQTKKQKCFDGSAHLWGLQNQVLRTGGCVQILRMWKTPGLLPSLPLMLLQ